MADILVPQLSENITSGTVTKISVNVGEAVTKGQTLFELETEKAVLEVPSPENGTVEAILIKVGDPVSPGQAAFRFGGATTAAVPTASAPAAVSTVVPAAAPAPAPVPLPQTAAAKPQAETPPPPAPPTTNVAAAPSVRHFARELGINITEVPSTNEHHRISIDDVKTYAKHLLSTIPGSEYTLHANAQRAGDAGGGAPGRPQSTKLDEDERGAAGGRTRERSSVTKMTAIRLKTAEHMARSWSTIPHVTQFANADITEVDKLRQKSSTPELKLTITPFVIKVIASALKHFPKFNASIDMV
ncbi:MAG: 2-oxo acid dehydrogenase subunit E2, partial [Candidatus Omnitrophica bacterium]|nr:2-oxo acid dehydrogenase subunit E2 [Candidatus Omnitrophota bacterium]